MVPEFTEPIRVRWYRLPDDAPRHPSPGVYTSSDWDLVPWDVEPLGERTALRHPHADWRDCSPPPWKLPGCKHCLAGSFDRYTLAAIEEDPDVTIATLAWSDLCVWGPGVWVPAPGVTASFHLVREWPDVPHEGPMLVIVFTFSPPHSDPPSTWYLPLPDTWNCQDTQDLGPQPVPYYGYRTFRLRGKPETSVNLLTESGKTLDAEGGYPIATES